MPESRFHTRLRAKIEEVSAPKEERLIAGGAADYATYREMVGELTGLRLALALCRQIDEENQ